MIEKKAKSVRLNSQDMTLGGLLARGIPGGSNMTDCPNLEMLSALIDGKLSSDARERVVAHLGNCAVCSSVVSDSMTIREELTIRSRVRIRTHLVYSIPAGLAAAAVLLIAFRILQPAPEIAPKPELAAAERQPSARRTPLQTRPDAAVTTRSYAGELAARLPGGAAASLARISGERSPSAPAYGFSSTVSLDKAAFGIGVCLADLEVALKAKDKEKVEFFAKKLIELLKPMESSYGLIPSIMEQRGTIGDPGKEAGRYEGFSKAVETLFENKKEAVFLKFGAWVEAAGLAAAARDGAFFQPVVVRDFRKELETSGVPVGTLKNLSRLDSILSSGGLQAEQFKTITRLLADIKEMF